MLALMATGVPCREAARQRLVRVPVRVVVGANHALALITWSLQSVRGGQRRRVWDGSDAGRAECTLTRHNDCLL